MEAAIAFFAEWGFELLLGLVSAMVMGYAKFKGDKLKKDLDEAKALAKDKEKREIENSIENHLEPIYQELEDLRKYIRDTKNIEQSHMNLIIASYRFRLVQLCKGFINQGYMTMDQRTQLDEFYKLYTGLGGNGQAKLYYEQCIQLPPHP